MASAAGLVEAGLGGIDVLAPILGVTVARDQVNQSAADIQLEDAVVAGVGNVEVAFGVESESLR